MNSLQKILRLYFFKLVDVSLLCYGNYVPEATKRYHLGVTYNFKQNMFQNKHMVKKFAEPNHLKLADFHTKLAEKRRAEILLNSKYGDDLIPVENCVMFDSDVPILFEDLYQLEGDNAMSSDKERDTIYRTIDLIESHSETKPDSGIHSTPNSKFWMDEGSLSQQSQMTTPNGRSRGNTRDRELMCDSGDFYYEVPTEVDPLSRIMSTPESESHTVKYFQDEYLDMNEDSQMECCPHDEESTGVRRTVPIQPLILARLPDVADCNPKPHRHLVVLVSGYMGSSLDMTFLKNNLMLLNGENTFFVC